MGESEIRRIPHFYGPCDCAFAGVFVVRVRLDGVEPRPSPFF